MSNGVVNAAAGAVSTVLDAAGNVLNVNILHEVALAMDVTFATEVTDQ